jgi:hypothetical protein
MRKVLLPVLMLLTLALACSGASWADALHGQCNGTGTGTCSDNGTNTPLGNSTTYGFTISPGPQTGVLFIDLLVPDNYTVPAGGFAITPTVTATQVAGVWSSGSLAGFLGFSPIPGANPNNPIGAFLPTTQALDPTATGFNVFQADLGLQIILGNSGAMTAGGQFTIPSGFGNDAGGYIVGFCFSCTDKPGSFVATANSGALLVDGTPTPTPEPASMLLLGLGLAGAPFLRRRK